MLEVDCLDMVEKLCSRQIEAWLEYLSLRNYDHDHLPVVAQDGRHHMTDGGEEDLGTQSQCRSEMRVDRVLDREDLAVPDTHFLIEVGLAASHLPVFARCYVHCILHRQSLPASNSGLSIISECILEKFLDIAGKAHIQDAFHHISFFSVDRSCILSLYDC